ncbi:MAG: hypothetical protein IH852_08370 [Bacteroidetes bacterium]|nr:hypothetical protein [Bacteroidota bacterium]
MNRREPALSDKEGKSSPWWRIISQTMIGYHPVKYYVCDDTKKYPAK